MVQDLGFGVESQRTGGLDLGVLEGDGHGAAGEDFQAVAQRQRGHDRLRLGPPGQGGQVNGRGELYHVVQRGARGADDLVHLLAQPL